MSEIITSVADSRREVKLAEKDIARFWSKVDKDGPIPAHVPEIGNCWVWIPRPHHDGYGVFSHTHTRQVRAHRFSFLIHAGYEARNLVLHSCDNPICVRPTHLRDGTVRENSADAVARGRTAVGERHGSRTRPESVQRGEQQGMSKLTESKVIEIREKYAVGNIGLVSLGEQYGVSHSLVGLIVKRKAWKHVGGPVAFRGHRPSKY